MYYQKKFVGCCVGNFRNSVHAKYKELYIHRVQTIIRNSIDRIITKPLNNLIFNVSRMTELHYYLIIGNLLGRPKANLHEE
jgi:hypothetical protein